MIPPHKNTIRNRIKDLKSYQIHKMPYTIKLDVIDSDGGIGTSTQEVQVFDINDDIF